MVPEGKAGKREGPRLLEVTESHWGKRKKKKKKMNTLFLILVGRVGLPRKNHLEKLGRRRRKSLLGRKGKGLIHGGGGRVHQEGE